MCFSCKIETVKSDVPQGERVPEAHAARPYQKVTQVLHWGAISKVGNPNRVEEKDEGALRLTSQDVAINEVMMKRYHVSGVCLAVPVCREGACHESISKSMSPDIISTAGSP